jgi:redox-sensitive bicupin YhaK (pirin superfamily)
LNDDIVTGGMGFGIHPHDNMEIVSIPLKGAIEHKDTLGTTSVIYENDIQLMSAGTGISHSEFNHSKSEPVNFLQIWIFPKVKNTAPRYDQKTFDPKERVNKFQLILSPEKSQESIQINQDAFFYLATLEEGRSLEYLLKSKNHGVYVFVIEGEVTVAGDLLKRRDGIAITEIEDLTFKAQVNAEILLMEIPF